MDQTAEQKTPVGQGRILFLVLLTAALIGANFSALKASLEHTTPILLSAMRTLIGGSFLVAVAAIRRETFPRRREDLINIFAVSLSITTISSALLIIGVNRVSAGLGSLVASTMPLFTAVLSVFLLNVAISKQGRLGLLVGFAGTAILALPSFSGGSASGVLILLLAAVAWAYGTVYMKWKDFSRVSPYMLVGVQLFMSAAILLPTALLLEGTSQTNWSIELLLPLLYNSIPANAVTFSLMALIVKLATPTQAAATAYLIPLFGVFFGWLFRGETLGMVEAAGAVFVLGGVYLVVDATNRG